MKAQDRLTIALWEADRHAAALSDARAESTRVPAGSVSRQALWTAWRSAADSLMRQEVSVFAFQRQGVNGL